MTVLIGLAAANLYFLAVTELWLWAIVFGLVVPTFGVREVRRTSNLRYGDKLLAWLTIGQLGMLPLTIDRAEAQQEYLRRSAPGGERSYERLEQQVEEQLEQPPLSPPTDRTNTP